MNVSAETCGDEEYRSQQEKKRGKHNPVVVGSLGERGQARDCGRGLRHRRRGRRGLDRCHGRRCCLGRNSRGLYRGTCCWRGLGLLDSRISAGTRLTDTITRHIARIGLPRRGCGACGLDRHMCRRYPSASTMPAAPKVPPAGATRRAATSDPRLQATPASVPVASSQDASTTSVSLAASASAPSSSKHTP